MTRLISAIAICAILPCTALAEQMFVDWAATSGPLPPQYAWTVTMTISTDGTLALTRCKGSATEGNGCTNTTAQVSKTGLDAIRAAVDRSDLAKRPMREMAQPPIGGSTVSAVVHLNGAAIAVSGFAAEADAERVGSVLAAIYHAVPPQIAQEYLEGD